MEDIKRLPFDPPEVNSEEQLAEEQTQPNRSSTGALQRRRSYRSEQSLEHYLSRLGSSFVHPSIPVESVHGDGEHTSECHNSDEGVVLNPYYPALPITNGAITNGDHNQLKSYTPPSDDVEEQQLVNFEPQKLELVDQNNTDDDDFENSEGFCEEHYRECSMNDTDQIVVRGIEPPGDPPEDGAELEQSEAIIVRSTPDEEKGHIEELKANIHNQLVLLESSEISPPQDCNGYSHNFVTVRDEHRFLMLYTLLKRHTDAKIIIFFSTTKSTQYYSKLLQRLKFDARAVHNGQTKEVFLSQYLEFSQQASSGILCIPDFQSEFSIPPSCEWIIQFEPPSNPNEYIFRVGGASFESSSVNGRALLFVTPEQFGVLQYFIAARVKLREYEIAKISQVQKDYTTLIRKDKKLRKLAKEAYHAYMLAYASHGFRDVYNIHDLNQDNVALSFGFIEAPKHPSDSDDEERREAPGDRKWKPVKIEKNTNWMRREKTWRYSERYSERHSSKKMERSSSTT